MSSIIIESFHCTMQNDNGGFPYGVHSMTQAPTHSDGYPWKSPRHHSRRVRGRRLRVLLEGDEGTGANGGAEGGTGARAGGARERETGKGASSDGARQVAGLLQATLCVH